MKIEQLHKDIKEALIHYHLEVNTFNPIDTEFHYFNTLQDRIFLQMHQEQMNNAELLMLALVDKMAIKEYQILKSGRYHKYTLVENLLQYENVQDLKKVVLLAMKNIKNNSFTDLAVKVEKLSYSNLIFNSCMVEIKASKRLLELAKKAVEIAIEQDQVKALEIINA